MWSCSQFRLSKGIPEVNCVSIYRRSCVFSHPAVLMKGGRDLAPIACSSPPTALLRTQGSPGNSSHRCWLSLQGCTVVELLFCTFSWNIQKMSGATHSHSPVAEGAPGARGSGCWGDEGWLRRRWETHPRTCARHMQGLSSGHKTGR